MVEEDSDQPILFHMHVRLSVLCVRETAAAPWRILHIHSSEPSAVQQADEFLPQRLVENYNRQLEKMLEQRTCALEEKSRDLEAISNNIIGGVQICRCDETFTILYASSGFSALTGYDDHALEALGRSHLSLVFSEDADAMNRSIQHQLAEGSHFSTEYRMVRRDDSFIWVLDRGRLLPSGDAGEARIQCTLMDITARKQQEEALRLSEKRYEIAMCLSAVTMLAYNIPARQLVFFNGVNNDYGIGSVLEGGRLHEYELSLTSVFDETGAPQRAIGVRKNVSEMRKPEKEQAFSRAMMTGKLLVCEANITQDEVIFIHEFCSSIVPITPDTPFSAIARQVAEAVVDPEHQSALLRQLSLEHISALYAQGQGMFLFSYRRQVVPEVYEWYEATVAYEMNLTADHMVSLCPSGTAR